MPLYTLSGAFLQIRLSVNCFAPMEPRDSWLQLSHLAGVLSLNAKSNPRVYQNWTRVLRIVLGNKAPNRRGTHKGRGRMKELLGTRSPHAAWKCWIFFASRLVIVETMRLRYQFEVQTLLAHSDSVCEKH